MTLHQQAASLALMVALGIWFGASFSVYQYFIHPEKGRRWILLITDCLFFLLQAGLFFALLLPVNQGQLRFYYLLGMALGFTFYKGALETRFMRFFTGAVTAAVRIGHMTVRIIHHLLIHPIFFLLMLGYRLCKITVNTILRILLFLIAIPLKIIRGVIRLVLPERMRVSMAGYGTRMRQKFGQWASWFRKRK